MKLERRALGPKFPQIVGHEFAGEVVATGSRVSKFKVGSLVGVRTMVNSCRQCTECQAGHENYCLNGNTDFFKKARYRFVVDVRKA